MTDRKDEEQEYEEYYTFVGCTCAHTSGEHGWTGCEVAGCPCEGAWEE